MQKPIALDASALLALILGEVGGGGVEQVISNSVISAVNWSEVLKVLQGKGASILEWAERLYSLNLEVRGFDARDAEIVASLDNKTRSVGLSLGDRACLALGERYGLEVLTAEKSWAALKFDFKVSLIR